MARSRSPATVSSAPPRSRSKRSTPSAPATVSTPAFSQATSAAAHSRRRFASPLRAVLWPCGQRAARLRSRPWRRLLRDRLCRAEPVDRPSLRGRVSQAGRDPQTDPSCAGPRWKRAERRAGRFRAWCGRSRRCPARRSQRPVDRRGAGPDRSSPSRLLVRGRDADLHLRRRHRVRLADGVLRNERSGVPEGMGGVRDGGAGCCGSFRLDDHLGLAPARRTSRRLRAAHCRGDEIRGGHDRPRERATRTGEGECHRGCCAHRASRRFGRQSRGGGAGAAASGRRRRTRCCSHARPKRCRAGRTGWRDLARIARRRWPLLGGERGRFPRRARYGARRRFRLAGCAGRGTRRGGRERGGTGPGAPRWQPSTVTRGPGSSEAVVRGKRAMTQGTRLFILAVDHRGSFEKMVGGDSDTLFAAKRLVWQGFLDALMKGAPRDSSGLLIDEQYGSRIAREAHEQGIVFAMPVEKTGRDEFEFEHGDAFGRAIENYDPSYAKALVRYNPDGDFELNGRQVTRLRRLSEWLRAHDRRFMFELLVPPTDEQLSSVAGSRDRYDGEVRPALML